MSSSESKMDTAKTVLSTLASVAATAMVARTIVHDYLPHQIQDYLFFGSQKLFKRFSNQLTMAINEFDGLVTNELYAASKIYLSTKISPNTHRLKVTKPEKEKRIAVTMERNEEITDIFDGTKLKWVWICQKTESRDFYNPHDMNSTFRSEVQLFELTFHKKHKETILNSYFPYILEEAKKIKNQNNTAKIFTINTQSMYSNYGSSWTSLSLDHPANFDTLAMDTKVKEMVVKDLERFVKRREYYRKVGKAWKRGYLLYGPPGTGKSSLIAAMANYLKFDIYDLELTDIRRNSDLRRLLVATGNRSILVVEDIDCTAELQDRLALKAPSQHQHHMFHQEENKVTLSGFLNFIDGLWSSCGDERIIIFTTNHKEKLDPALLRPGRMDLHIHMSYCTPCGFKLLAANYLGLTDHHLFPEIEELISTSEVTPAEVAEQLLKSDDPNVTLSGLIDFLHLKIKENEEAKIKKAEMESVEDEKKSAEGDEAEEEVPLPTLQEI